MNNTAAAAIEETIAALRTEGRTAYEAHLLAHLQRVTDDWAAPLAPLRAVRPSAGRSGRSEPPLPVRPALSDARYDIAVSLYGWCQVLIEDRGLSHAAAHREDVPGMCALLRRHADWWERHGAAEDMLAEIRERSDALHAVVSPDPDSRVIIGRCPLTHPDDPAQWCRGRVSADPDRMTARCPTCRAEESIDWWRERMPVAEYVTIRELTQALIYEGMPMVERAVRSAIDKGAVEVVGKDARGRRLVDRAAAIRAMRRRRRPTS